MIQLTRQLLPALLAIACCIQGFSALAQSRREDVYTDVVLYQKRTALEKDLRDRIIARNLALPLDSDTEDKYLSACWAISQFLFQGPEVSQGFAHLFKYYDSLSFDTKKAFLEALYAVGSNRHVDAVRGLLTRETDARLFTLAAVYCYRSDTGTANANTLKIAMAEQFPGYDTIPLLQELGQYLSYAAVGPRNKMPDIPALFRYHKSLGKKIVYSFQRWDRDYPGLCVVMDEQGHFIKDAQGRVQMFRQLARSGSGLPYFISNGNTPQGAFCITGTAVSRTSFIGPTPNLQMIMPFEESWEHFFFADSNGKSTIAGGTSHHASVRNDATRNDAALNEAPATESAAFDSLQTYLSLFPPSWRSYAPILESWTAGHLGRTEIIAHGTTIDPEYFKDRPFYPLTPTMGCLCAREEWNPTSGHPLVSEQLNLANAFRSTPVQKGYLIVIDVDDRRQPVSREEIENWIKKSE